MKALDDSTLEEIAAMVCGEEAGMKYRRGWELPQFLRRAGLEDVPDHDGTPRHAWILEILRDRQDEDSRDIEAVVLRLANKLEYLQEPSEYAPVLARLQDVLALEGLHVEYREGSPGVVAYDPGHHARHQRVELKVAITDIVDDPDLARTVQLRLDEAHICQEHGAYTAAVIMLGSLLEGVLIHAAQVRPATDRLPRQPSDSSLHDLIRHAHTNRWIDQDAKLASDLVRTYRNLVHPLAEKRAQHSADFDTADLCWSTVNAVLNDLAASSPS